MSDVTSSLESYRDYYGAYHNHKEQMAYGATVFYLGAATWGALSGHSALPVGGLRTFTLVVFAVAAAGALSFIAWQLDRRRVSAVIVAACNRLLAQPPQLPGAGTAATYARVTLPSYLAGAADQVSKQGLGKRGPIVSEIVTWVVLLAWTVWAGIMLTQASVAPPTAPPENAALLVPISGTGASVDWVAIAGIAGTLIGTIVGSWTTWRIQRGQQEHDDRTRFHERRLTVYADFTDSANKVVSAVTSKQTLPLDEIRRVVGTWELLRLVASPAVIGAAMPVHGAIGDAVNGRVKDVQAYADKFNTDVATLLNAMRAEIGVKRLGAG